MDVPAQSEVTAARANVDANRASSWDDPTLLPDIPNTEVVATEGKCDNLGLGGLEEDGVEAFEDVGRRVRRGRVRKVELRDLTNRGSEQPVKKKRRNTNLCAGDRSSVLKFEYNLYERLVQPVTMHLVSII